MATQLEIQTNNPLETAVDAAETQGGVGVQQTDAAIFEAALAEAEEILQSQRQAREISPLLRAWSVLVSFYDWLSGPPATQQERINAELERFEYESRTGAVRPL